METPPQTPAQFDDLLEWLAYEPDYPNLVWALDPSGGLARLMFQGLPWVKRENFDDCENFTG